MTGLVSVSGRAVHFNRVRDLVQIVPQLIHGHQPIKCRVIADRVNSGSLL